jgi:hypothetical protein
MHGRGHNPGRVHSKESPMRVAMITAVLLFAGSGCTWVKMGPGAADVGVARAGQNMSACERRGEVAVSVKDRLGPYERNTIQVRDELETLARNEAPGMGADTVQPKGDPVDGEQRFTAWRCAGASTAAARTTVPAEGAETRPLEQGEVETLPLDD